MKPTVIAFLLAFIVCCVNRKYESIDVKLSIEEREQDVYLYVEIVNNTNSSVYLPNWSFMSHLRMYSAEGKDVTAKVNLQELHHRLITKGSPISISNNDVILGYEDLKLAPITERKKLIKSAVCQEMDSLLKINNIEELDDSLKYSLTEDLLMGKYAEYIFIDSKSTYIDSISITTLFKSKESFRIIFSYIPNRDSDKIPFVFILGSDTLVVPYKHMEKIEKYHLIKQTIADSICIGTFR
jgi:hypothetical protein